MYQPDQQTFDREFLQRANFTLPEVFISTMIPDEIALAIPEFHVTVFARMMSSASKQCYALPRGTAKTTLVQLAVVWHLIYTEHTYCLYVSAIHSNAANYVEQVINIMTDEGFSSIYGELDFSGDGYKRKTDGDYSFLMNKIIFEHGKDADGNPETLVKTRKARIRIQCKGAGQAVRGIKKGATRPSLLIMDDIEDKELLTTGNSEGNYTKLSNWVESTLIKALDKTKMKIIQIGNLVAAKSVLMDNLDDDNYASMIYGIIKENGEPLWPELWGWKDIQDDYNSYLKKNKIALWYAEMMNFPRPPGGGILRIDEIRFKQAPLPEASNNLYGCITVDLAASDQSYSHATAATVHIFDGEVWNNCDGFCEVGLDPIQLLNKIVYLSDKWRINFVGLESVAFQAVLGPIYAYILATRNINHISFVKCPARKSKTERITAYAGLIRESVVAISGHRNKTVNQLLKYDILSNTNDDDDIDAAAHIGHMLAKYGGEIAKGYTRQQSRYNSHGTGAGQFYASEVIL